MLEQGSDAESSHEEEETGKDSKDDRKVMLLFFFINCYFLTLCRHNQLNAIHFQMQEDRDEDSQCLSDDTDTEISTQVYV